MDPKFDPDARSCPPTRLAELHRLVAEAEQRRAKARPFRPWPYALGGLLAGAGCFAAGMWAASRHLL